MGADQESEDAEPLECHLFGSSSFEEESVEAVRRHLGEDRVRLVEGPEDLPAEDPGRPSTGHVHLYRRDSELDWVRERLERSASEWREVPLICVVDENAWRDAAAALRDGASDYLFADELRSPNLEARLRAAIGRHQIESRDRRVRRELEERSSELLGVNALANGVSNTLDRELIIRRGLWVFAGVCQQDVAALLEVRPRSVLPDSSEDDEEAEPHLERTGTFASGEIEILDSPVELDPSWRNIIVENHVAELEGEPSEEVFGDLEEFWNRYPEGCVRIVPVRANQNSIGALVLAEKERSGELALSRDGLQAMALQFGSALENAYLFEKIKRAYDSLQETQDQLVHAEKFAAVGILAAEIAHEINNPASFVISNLSVMVDYAESITEFLEELDVWLSDVEPDLEEHFSELKREYEVGYLRDDMNALLSRSLSGMQRIHQVVQDLRYLSREQGEEPGWIELESLLDATVNLVSHEAKFRAQLERDYDDVSQVMSDSSRLSQVFLNLLVNAVQSIEGGEVEENYIRVATEERDDSVVVSIEDSGSGIPPELQDEIFEPFFSTKETGEGTGLGLSISRDIVRSLGGTIDYESEPGEGTTFRVTIPIRAEKFERDRDLRDSGYYTTPPGLEEISDEVFES